jgi:excisionase family DNA binding protein
MSYTLATAADAAKVTKPTVFRWIKAGRLSATKADDGTYRIDPAELHRYLDANKATPAPTEMQQSDTVSPAPEMDIEALQATVALRCEVEKLKALLEIERQRAEEWKGQADRWASQSERLAIAPPITPNPTPEPVRVSWWPFRRAG